jgi:hypothetical protein
VLGAGVSAVIALVFDGLGNKVRQRFPWRTPLESRLWTYEKPNPATEVQVILRSPDVRRARTVLRHARFNPAIYGVRLVRPPADAPDLEFKIAVHEPEAWPQSASDADRTQRIVRVLASAGIRGRANGVDAWPEGEATAQSGRIRPAALPRA